MRIRCIQCQEDFDAKRKDAKFCSDSCRKKNKRGISITAGKTPEEARDLKYKEMQNQANKEDLPTIDVDDNKEVVLSSDEKRFGKITKEEAEAFIEEYESKFSAKSSKTQHMKLIEMRTSGAYCECVHCGEVFGHAQGERSCAKYCKQCRTKDHREYIDKLNYCVDMLSGTPSMNAYDCDCGFIFCGELPVNEALPKDHPMRHHPAWAGVIYPCTKCGKIISKTINSLCSKCNY